VAEDDMNKAPKANKAVSSSTVAVGVILALGTAAGQTVRMFGDTQAVDSNQPETRAAESELGISVAVYNYAAVPESTLVKAEAETHRIFAKAGIKIAWRDCDILGKRVECPSRDHSSLAADMALRILPSPMVKRLGAGDREGGLALPCPVGETVCHADIFYERAEDLARGGCADLWQILAFLAAHELGHLLLGSDSHSPGGIMRPRWDPLDCEEAAQGQVTFTPRQAEQLRAELRKGSR
jgi:hypothetical protein